MTKNTKHRRTSRRREERQRKQRRNLLISGAAILVIGGLVAFFAARGGLNPPPDVPQERLEQDPIMGNPDAPVTIIEYGSYGCPACQRVHNSGLIDGLLDSYGDQVNFTFRDFPVISPAYDQRSAETAQCVLDQSEDAFWSFHNALYERDMIGASQAELYGVVESLGIERAPVESCVSSETHRRTVQYDEDRARERGLTSTPAFVIGDREVIGANETELRRAIEAELAS